ncbi:MAG: phosphoadenylyl-sulfate reductase [Flavobacteriales bacterium]
MTLDDKVDQTIAQLLLISEEFKGKIAFSTSLGEEDQVLTWFIAKHHLNIHIFTLDTGRLFNESYELIRRTEKKFEVSIDIRFPDSSRVQNMVKDQGINGFYDSLEARKRCCNVRKIQPLKSTLDEFDAWITGLRAEQSDSRSNVPFRSNDEFFAVEKFNPLHNWSLSEIQQLIERENIPTNPLHKKGYVSIGCAPCTRAIEKGEHPRTGRWWWESSKKECGLHATQLK